ncbi:serine/threonine-protein kinase [Chitinimonas sp.]|uniref:serine/threonine-protein kinase n=1 Tax=Chitinimonas sp. TaxID=1934313 RepID=UPI002F94E584
MDKLGHYRIEATLGQGAMGVVYRATDERLERTVALKVLSLSLSSEERAEYAARLQQEAKSAARLNHPNIITVYDCGDIDDHAFLAIEFVDGKTLQSLLASGVKISPAKLVKLAGQLFGALAYAHEHDVVHRDIKPANLMLTPDGRLKITDFGIAQLPTSDLTRVGTVVGSPRYMAPEQVEGKKLDGRADIFAAGIVLYEILTGKRPFDGEHVATIAYRILHETPEDIRSINPDVPEWLAELVMRCLEKDPANRFQTAREARSALREQASTAAVVGGNGSGNGKPAEANGGEAAPKASKPVVEESTGGKRNLLPWLGLGGVVLVIALGVGLMGRKPAKPATTVVEAPAAAPAIEPEVLPPPGASGSLPAQAAMPMQQNVAADAPPPPSKMPIDPNENARPKADSEQDKAAAKKAKTKGKTAQEAAPAAEPPKPLEHHEPPPPPPKKEPEKKAPVEKQDDRSLLERLAGCTADGQCPKSKLPPKRDR